MFTGKGEPLCRKARGMLSDYIDSSLSSESKSFVERHIETCEACSKELESLRMTVQLLHRVSEVPVPRSFTVTVPQPRRERAFVPVSLRWLRPATDIVAVGPASLRWLRPVTAIVAVALVVLLMGDFLNAFENNTGINSGESNLTASSTFDKSVPSPVPTEPPIMVNIPGIMGQMSLATAKAVGYTDYTIVRSAPSSMALQPESSSTLIVSGSGLSGSGYNEATDATGAGGAAGMAQGESGVGWPLRQTEIGLGAAVFVLLALIIFARRQRTKEV